MIKIRPYSRKSAKSPEPEGFTVDIRVLLPDGTEHRERKRSPVKGRTATERWAQARERELFVKGLAPKKPAAPARPSVPTLTDFWPLFLTDHVKANGQKASGRESKEQGFRVHLEPLLGALRLDDITTAKVAGLKSKMITDGKAHATINNTLSLLSKLLKVAIDWDVITALPCKIQRLKQQAVVPKFYDFDEYKKLLEVARNIDPRAYLLILLGADAGLRRGEIIALPSALCDTKRGLISVEWSEWNGQLAGTKGMEARVVPMTARLKEALTDYKHIMGPRVLYTDDGTHCTNRTIRAWMSQAQSQIKGLKCTGEVHILRHTFCSHLAMRGAPVQAIQNLAGHKHLTTTLRYMHLAPGETERAIRLLEAPSLGNRLATGKRSAKNAV